MTFVAPPNNAVSTVNKTPLYLEAVDFLTRMKSEGKENELNAELFLGIYGVETYNSLLVQGYFSHVDN